MNFHFIDEPKLEFGRNRHLCPRSGIAEHQVYDVRRQVRRDKIHVGAIGLSDSLERLNTWLDRCSRYIPGKLNSRQPTLYPSFCGFNPNVGFKAQFVYHDEISRTVTTSEIKDILRNKIWDERVNAAADLFHTKVKFLAQNRTVDVIVCVIPDVLYDKIAKIEMKPVEETIDSSEQDDILEMNFRRLLKARIMPFGVPIQLIREASLEPEAKNQQDDATKAWNFCTALYFKANQTVPWKLVTNVNRASVCFVGIGFYRSRDKKKLHTSLAQIFDELGNGVILRGTPVDLNKDDREPHLTTGQSHDLLKRALEEYRVALDTFPGRLVIHKSSNFNDAEIDGFRSVTQELRIKSVDFVTILDTDCRLFRKGIYPPYRGTHIEFDKATHLLYTRGAVKYYKTYPGLYVPQPLEIRIVESDESPGVLCNEILSLTKMNWNNTQFDGKYPITIECARKVGQVMKYLGEKDPEPQISYSFYM